MTRTRLPLLLTVLALLALVLPALPVGRASAAPATAPTVPVFTSPAAGATISGTVTLSVSTANTVIVTYYLDSTANPDLGTASSAGFPFTWDSTVAAGQHTLIAVATGIDGTATSAPLPVTLANPTPTLRVVSPADDGSVGTHVSFTVVATPAPGGLPIDHVSYYVDTTDPSAKQSTSTAPYGLVANVPTGRHTVYVYVVDIQGKFPPPTVIHLSVRAHTSFFLTAPGTSATSGAREQLSATLLDEDSQPVSGQTVLVEAEPAGARRYSVIRSVRSGSSGSISAPFTLGKSAKVKLVYAGSRVWQASSSRTFSVAVRPAWRCTGTGTKPTTLRCASSPKLAGRVVTARVGGRAVATTKTARDGTAVLRASAPAGQQLAVTLRGDASYAAATATVTVPTPAGSGGPGHCSTVVVNGRVVIVCTGG